MTYQRRGEVNVRDIEVPRIELDRGPGSDREEDPRLTSHPPAGFTGLSRACRPSPISSIV